jgi:glycosyltransferase involved in cell wall biosynthesis
VKAQGTKIVWTAHNVRQHEGRHRWLEERFWDKFLPMVDGCICLSESSWKELSAARPLLACPHTVVPHGHYRDIYPMTTTRSDARKALAIPEDCFVFVNVGLVRPYKNIPRLIDTFSQLSGEDRLVIAGECFDPGLEGKVSALAAKDRRIVYHSKRVNEKEMQVYYRAADLAVLPFKSILNSGSALLALSFDVPVLVPALGSMPELRTQVGSDWVTTYSGELTPAVLQTAKKWTQSQPRGRAPLDSLDWGPIAESTLAFYHHLSGRG